jgi:hypothetical protein
MTEIHELVGRRFRDKRDGRVWTFRESQGFLPSQVATIKSDPMSGGKYGKLKSNWSLDLTAEQLQGYVNNAEWLEAAEIRKVTVGSALPAADDSTTLDRGTELRPREVFAPTRPQLGGIRLISVGQHGVEVHVEVDGVWRRAIREHHDCSGCCISHIVETDGEKPRRWPSVPVDDLFDMTGTVARDPEAAGWCGPPYADDVPE